MNAIIEVMKAMGVLAAGMFNPKGWQEEMTPVAKAFHLHNGQMRTDEHSVAHNGVWFNAQGEKLGCGDLNVVDLPIIRANLRRNDRFVVLHENDGHIDRVTRNIDQYGWNGNVPQSHEPGPVYVATKCCWIITGPNNFSDGVIYRVQDSYDHKRRPNDRGWEWAEGADMKIKVMKISRNEAFRLLGLNPDLVCRHGNYQYDCWSCDNEMENATSEACSMW